MGCTCGRTSNESLLKDFWDSFPIRRMSSTNYYIYLKNFDDISQDTFSSIVFSNKLFLTDDKETDNSIRQLLSEFIKEYDFRIVLISFIFLTKSETADELFITFKNICDMLKIKIYFIDMKQLLLIKSHELEKVLKTYVELVSLYTIDFVKSRSTDSEFENAMKQHYSLKNIEIYVGEMISNFISENILLKRFFEDSFEKLRNDGEIRNQLHKIQERDSKGVILETPGR
jgi:hypothetical protein